MKEYLEFKDGTSYKFWQIEVIGKKHIVTYGRIGTEGQRSEKEFETEEKALKDAQSLLNSKIKKGYQTQSEKSEAIKSKNFHVNYDNDESNEDLKNAMTEFFNSKKATETNEIIFGEWEEPFDTNPKELLDLLIENRSKLPNLKHLRIGDMPSDVCEISWILQTDITPVLNAFPNLETLWIRGSNGLEFKTIKHSKLKKLVIECGGLSEDVIDAIAEAELPSLEHLELYLGTDDYGFSGTISNIKPFFDKGRFPSLKYLGLVDSEIADDIAEEIVKSDILDQIEVLDLSMGTLSDKGAKALLGCDKINKLKRLDLHFHYITDDVMNEFKKFKIPIDLSDQQEDDEGYRYVQVGE